MNTDMIKSQLFSSLRDKEYRHLFVSQHLSTNIASQIFAMRERHNWTQEKLAKEAGMAQTRISLLEDPNYENFSINTLKRLAVAFDVAVIVRFVAFGELADWIANISPESLAPPSFNEELNMPVVIKQEAERKGEVQKAKILELPSPFGPYWSPIAVSALKGTQPSPAQKITPSSPPLRSLGSSVFQEQPR